MTDIYFYGTLETIFFKLMFRNVIYTSYDKIQRKILTLLGKKWVMYNLRSILEVEFFIYHAPLFRFLYIYINGIH